MKNNKELETFIVGLLIGIILTFICVGIGKVI